MTEAVMRVKSFLLLASLPPVAASNAAAENGSAPSLATVWCYDVGGLSDLLGAVAKRRVGGDGKTLRKASIGGTFSSRWRVLDFVQTQA